MKEEGLVRKLQSIELPGADLEDHRHQLRAALLARGARTKLSRSSAFRSMASSMRMRADVLAAHWKAQPRRLLALGAAALAVIIVVLMVVLMVAPFLQGQSSAAQAAEIACNSTEVKEAVGGDDFQIVNVIEGGGTSVVILRCAGDAPGSGNLVVASVDMSSRTVTSATVLGNPASQSTYSGGDVLIGSLTDDGANRVFFNAGQGLYAVSEGRLQWSASFAGAPRAVIDDVTGDGARDLVVSSGSLVCCYDGVTGEKVWQSEGTQRRVFWNGLGWGCDDLCVQEVEVLRSGASQIITVRSEGDVSTIDAQNGTELWRFEPSERVSAMAAVPDRDSDGTDELLLGTYEGNLCLVSGSAGRVEWRRDIGQEWVEYDKVQHGAIESIYVAGDGRSRALISVRDGRVCLIDLGCGDTEWENQVAYRELRNSLGLWPVPDVTGDGLSDALVNTGYVKGGVETSTSPDGVTSISMPLRTVVLLSGVDGSEVWTGEMYTAGSAIANINGQPAALEIHPQLGIRAVSLKDGQTAVPLAMPALNGGASQIDLMSDGSYLIFTGDGALVAVSPAGELKWTYLRMSQTEVRTGRLNSDAIPDLLVLGQAAGAQVIRQVSVLDGIAYREVWRYDLTGTDPATVGGLSGVEVVDDLTGDSVQDVLACAGSTVFRFSGADGSLARFDVGASITSLQLMKVGGGAAGILAATEEGLAILDGNGVRLWESACTDWSDPGFAAARVLNDLNQDGVSDQVLTFADRMLVAKSTIDGPLGFETLRSFSPGDNRTIELKDLTNDIDGDGTQEIAYFEYDKEGSVAGGALLVVSPATGQVWHRWDMPVTVDLACGDFNGDGFRDSLLHRQGKLQQPPDAPWHGRVYAPTLLEVYSGKDNSILWTHTFDEDRWHAGSEKMPAASAGDLTGDGVDDLAVSSIVALQSVMGFSTDSAGVITETPFLHETQVSVYDVARGTMVKEVTLPPAQKDGMVASDEGHHPDSEPVSGPGDAMRLTGDLNGDGHQELAILAGYLPRGGHCLALVDLETERILGYTTSVSTLDFFETTEDSTVGFTDKGSVCLARLSNSLQVTCPGEGATVGSRVRIAWDGGADASSYAVFVDGYENARTSGSEVTLPLRPGEHEVVVRSIDECGTVAYATIHFTVEGMPWVSILAGVSVVAMLLLYFAARWARVLCNRRAQRAKS